MLNWREQVEQAPAQLKAAPGAPGIARLVAQHVSGVSRARINAVLQEPIREERAADRLELLD